MLASRYSTYRMSSSVPIYITLLDVQDVVISANIHYVIGHTGCRHQCQYTLRYSTYRMSSSCRHQTYRMSSSDVQDVFIRCTGCRLQTYRMSSSDVQDVVIRRTGCRHQTYRMSSSVPIYILLLGVYF